MSTMTTIKHISVDLVGMEFMLHLYKDNRWKVSDFALHEEVVVETFMGSIKAEVVAVREGSGGGYVDVRIKAKA